MSKNNLLHMLKAIFILPLAFLIVSYLMVYMVVYPAISPIKSAIGLVSIQSVNNSKPESIFSKITSKDKIGDSTTDNLETLEDSIDISTVTMPKYEQHYANLSIEDLSIDCKLYYGDSDAVLKKGAGQFMGSSLPGFGRPILIAAHNTTFFKQLEWAEPGIMIAIETSYGTYEYEITETKIAKYNDDTAYDLSLADEVLILYTCYPFGSLGYKSDRLFVYANKVIGPTVNR